ncbi:hypothetical protein ACCO45_001170 [Purpureocillium lilacinum]|uniref:Uncharacterized protein n=1 Tax=Purpureocillium lilacinum TaxID=33203 RepID=A0ACC4E956_PURLI
MHAEALISRSEGSPYGRVSKAQQPFAPNRLRDDAHRPSKWGSPLRNYPAVVPAKARPGKGVHRGPDDVAGEATKGIATPASLRNIHPANPHSVARAGALSTPDPALSPDPRAKRPNLVNCMDVESVMGLAALAPPRRMSYKNKYAASCLVCYPCALTPRGSPHISCKGECLGDKSAARSRG